MNTIDTARRLLEAASPDSALLAWLQCHLTTVAHIAYEAAHRSEETHLTPVPESVTIEQVRLGDAVTVTSKSSKKGELPVTGWGEVAFKVKRRGEWMISVNFDDASPRFGIQAAGRTWDLYESDIDRITRRGTES